jgi:tetratricopeptide (TPR) repeat protein
MTCDDVVTGEIVEKYVLDELSEESRDAFEQHYFACGRCFELLQTYRAVQVELARTREAAQVEARQKGWAWLWTWAPATAVLVIAVSVGLWIRPLSTTGRGPITPASPAGPTGLPGPAAPPTTSPPPSPSIEELARVEPPTYTASRLRGADEATARFQASMEQYQRGNYAAAATGLRAASTLDPEAPHIAFFLGMSELLAGRPRAAIDALGSTVALGESPYLEEAHFYLAKAHLQSRNVDAAARELKRAIELSGEREAEARQLLDAIASLGRTAK